MRVLTGILGVVVLAGAIAAPRPAAAGALAEIYRLAQENDAELASARAAARAGREAYPQARASALPTLSANARFAEVEREVTQTPFSDQGGGGGGNRPTPPFDDRFRSESFGVELRQPLFEWGIPAELRQGRHRVNVAELDLKSAQTRLRARVMQAYIGYLSAKAELEFANEEREAIASDMERIQGRYEVGEVSVTALREGQAALDLAETRIIEARTTLNEAREQLNEITTQWFPSLPDIAGEIPLEPPDPAGPQAWVDIAMQYNATYLSSLQQVDIAEDEITRRQSDLLPDLDLVAAYTDTDDTEFVFGSASNDTSIGIEANWQLFAGGRTRSEVREARALYDRSHAELEATRRRVAVAARNAYRRVESHISRVRALERAVTSARTAFESVEAEFEVGERTQADVLNARRNLYRALTDRATARYDFLAGVVELKLIAGILSTEDLMRLDAHLADAGGADAAAQADRE